MNLMTLYTHYLIGALCNPYISAERRTFLEAELDAELRAQGFINCGVCPFDTFCNLNHRGDCSVTQ